MKIYIDLETFSEIPLPTHGVYRYAEHASTRILLLAYAINNGPVTVVDIDNREIPGEDFYAATKDPEVLFVAHNSEFERLLMHYTGLWPGLPSIPHEQWIDTQLEAYYNGFPGSLEYACTAAGTPINKDPRGKRLVMKFSKPRRPSKSNPDTRWTKQNAPEDWQAFKEYCGTDVESMRSLHLRCHRIPAEEVEYSILTKKMNDRGICIDKPVVTNALSIINSLSTEMENKVMQITGGIKTSQRDKTLLWLEDHDCKLEDWSAATVDKALKNPELAYDVKEVLLTRSILSKTSTKKLQGMMATLRHDGRVGGTLQHYGAYRTGRWAGRLIQVQNFPRGTLKPHEINEVIKYLRALDRLALQVAYENPLDTISSCLRAMMIAEEEKLLVIADYSAIEARVLAWLAHQLDGLLEFHEGEDTYIIMAGVIYKISPTKVTQDQRKVGKDTVLGCLTPDTRVITRRGVIPLIEIKETDEVFDGIEWVKHEGVVFQGIKEVIECAGTKMTPDHLVLVCNEWKSWEEVLSEKSLYLKSAVATANGLLKDIFGELGGDLKQWLQSVVVDISGELISMTIYSEDQALDVIPVQNKNPLELMLENVVNILIQSWETIFRNIYKFVGWYTILGGHLKRLYVPVPAEILFLKDQTIFIGNPQNVVVNAKIGAVESRSHFWIKNYIKPGIICGLGVIIQNIIRLMPAKLIYRNGTILNNLYRMLKRSWVLMKRKFFLENLPLIESITKGIMNPRTLGGRLIQNKTLIPHAVYDIANAGPRNRFMILTDIGPLIVHNCGYNMGWETFMNQINNRGGEQITEKLARLAVEAYRAKNDRIASFWPNIEKAAKKALNNPDTQVKISYLIFEFDSLSDTLMMHLPSGRALFYPEPGLEKKKTKWGETRLAITFGEQQNTKWGRSSTYGGKLTENAVQAIAGDLMRYGFREAVRNDFPPIFTVHDELVAEIPDDNSRFRCYEDASKEFSRVIATRPDWAKVGKSKPNKDGKVYYGIPLTAEGFTTKRYAKNPLLENWAETGFKTTPKNGPRH